MRDIGGALSSLHSDSPVRGINVDADSVLLDNMWAMALNVATLREVSLNWEISFKLQKY